MKEYPRLSTPLKEEIDSQKFQCLRQTDWKNARTEEDLKMMENRCSHSIRRISMEFLTE